MFDVGTSPRFAGAPLSHPVKDRSGAATMLWTSKVPAIWYHRAAGVVPVSSPCAWYRHHQSLAMMVAGLPIARGTATPSQTGPRP